MILIKKILGKGVYGLAKGIGAVLDGLIYATETMVLIAKSFLRGCAVLISMGGCLFFFLMIGPLGAWLLGNPGILLLLMMILFIPVAGALFITYLKYVKYILTEYLFHTANCWMGKSGYSYKAFDHFKKAYRQAEEDRIKRERQRRYEQQREWEERFQQWNQQNTYSSSWSTGGTGAGGWSYNQYGFGQSGHQQNGYSQGTSNPYVAFREKYQKSCDVLGVPEDADQYRVKLAYRKMAKMHHPDVNQSPDATKKFQQINDAYEFLNEDNIQRYQQIKKH
ncbi:DnaJ domain-containing protein [Anoxynatronum buryatiense]|uniref:DnaJ domain-containing protein n=1 Tax=Anoxynatronum buryatiense TaxID=489973 RepID=A0AA46AHC1_9CLOT|nr:J domain-containing protein [Anoxynatronum buryatiense]SMP38620.1 DnaJ domain-containing protein [Anoxynatronum buryatiense]